jgi:hypothetical protein
MPTMGGMVPRSAYAIPVNILQWSENYISLGKADISKRTDDS